ncbi:Ig-like domain-containing protein [Desulfuromonas acetoxidans]|uniref:Ig-like domain-containing protein n=1 Tax=Desulfuromonas acetoxidans TaxID=891 RepID=UPI00293139C9|nr:Ig-like domain-containing protein [Desulfuromonas acetoxidans]
MKIKRWVLLCLALCLTLTGCDGGGHSHDTQAPLAMTVSPARDEVVNGATSVISVTFDEPLDATTIDLATISLEDGDGNAVAGTVSYDDSTYTVTFTPATVLQSLTTYTVDVAAGIADNAGNVREDDMVWSFSTSDFSPPDPPVSE